LASDNDTYIRYFDDNPYGSGWFTGRTVGGSWNTGAPWNQRDLYFREYYHPYYASGSLMTQTEDCGATISSYGSLTHSETLYGGTVTYYTRSQAADAGWPATFNEAEWDEIDPFGQITSSVQRYLRVAFKITRVNEYTTPYVHEITAEYFVESYEPQLANFTGLTGKQAIETIAELANYELGFFTNFDSTENITWDYNFDWPVAGFPGGHTFVSDSTCLEWLEDAGDLVFRDKSTGNRDIKRMVTLEGVLYGVDNVGNLYRFNIATSYWDRLATNSINLQDAIVYNDKIYMSGHFGALYEWDGLITINSVASGDGNDIHALVVYNNKLYGASDNGILREWNGTNAWVTVATGGANLYSATVFNSKVYCGSRLSGRLYEWDGVSATLTLVAPTLAETEINDLAVYNSKLYGSTSPNGKLYEWNGVNAWVEKAPQLNAQTDVYSLLVYNSKLYGGTGAGGRLFEWNDVNAWVEKAPQFGTVTTIWDLIIYDGSLRGSGGLYQNGKVYTWNDVNAWTSFLQGVPTNGYFTITLGSGTDGNWTLSSRCWKKTGNGDTGFGYRVYGGAFRTEVIISNQGYGWLNYIDNTDSIQRKKIVIPSGDYVDVLIERKGRIVKVSINEEVALVSYADTVSDSDFFNLDYGYLYADENDFEARIDYIKIKKDVAASDLFYLPKYYFKPKDDVVETDIELFADEHYIKLFNYTEGWERVYNYVTADYGDYSYTANDDTELDEPPSSEDTYGLKKLSISGGDFLRKEDTNVATGTARRYYNTYKIPRKKLKLLCKFLFQIDLSDQVKVYSREPSKIGGIGDGRWGDDGRWNDGGIWISSIYDFWFLPGTDFKVIGLSLDLEQYKLELDLEEILS
jgi:hypothetical protein